MIAREIYEMLTRDALAASVAAHVWSTTVDDQRHAAALATLAARLTDAIAEATVDHMSEQRLRELRATVDLHPNVRVALDHASERSQQP